GARRVGAGGQRDLVGVAVTHGDFVHGDPQVRLDQHRPRRVVALAVRGAAGVDGGRAVTVDDHPGGLAVVGVGRGDLHVAGHPDAELDHVPALPPAALLGPQALVARAGQHLVQRPDVVAAVVVGPARGLVRELVGRYEVLAPHFGGVHADLGREQVHRPLDRGGCLRAAGAAVGGDGRRVGHHDAVSDLDVGDVVR